MKLLKGAVYSSGAVKVAAASNSVGEPQGLSRQRFGRGWRVGSSRREAQPSGEAEFSARVGDRFGRFAACASAWLGSRWAFLSATLVIVGWGLSGPLFHYSDSWQLVINTGTTVVTFLMVFLIQNTQNRDARAINLKLDELIRAIDKARNHMIDIETLSDVELDLLHAQYERLKHVKVASVSRSGGD